MKQLAIISGKGGTGKTSFVAAFAQLASPAVLADCDVDAANLHLVLRPEGETKSKPYYGGYVVKFHEKKCTECGACFDVCRFKAISTGVNKEHPGLPEFNYYLCEGCGACVDICPVDAIDLIDRRCGTLYESTMRFGPMLHAELGIAEGTSGKLVAEVRERARQIAGEKSIDLIIIDGSPGIGCPVIASITGTDMVVIVTEPSVSGLHDLERIIGLANHFRIPSVVIINKWDLNPELTEQIENEAKAYGSIPIGRVEFDRAFVDSMIAGQTVLEYADGKIVEEIEQIWAGIDLSEART